MIQRIQSIFLLLAGGSFLSLFKLPFAQTDKAVSNSAFLADAAYGIQDHVSLMGTFGLAGALAIIAIFLFKNRSLQMRLTMFSVIAAVIGTILTVVLFMQEGQVKSSQVVNDGLGAYLGFAGLIFAILAYRFVQKDDKLVRSMDRLR